MPKPLRYKVVLTDTDGLVIDSYDLHSAGDCEDETCEDTHISNMFDQRDLGAEIFRQIELHERGR